jgi:uncharacterized membrane-anchored protein
MKRNQIIIMLTLLQIFFLGSMIWFHKAKIKNSRIVLLKTVPYDPYSMFRGFYVDLRYEISSLDSDMLKDSKDKKLIGGEEVFVKLKKAGNFWKANSAYLRKPNDNDIYIRGRVPNFGGFLNFSPGHEVIDLDYGIESFFLNEKSAKEVDGANRAGRIDWRGQDAQRKAAFDKLDEETKRIHDTGIQGYYFDKQFKNELQVWVNEGLISEETKAKVFNKYDKAFAEIKAVEDSLNQRREDGNKQILVEVAIDNDGFARPIRLLVDGKVYR